MLSELEVGLTSFLEMLLQKQVVACSHMIVLIGLEALLSVTWIDLVVP